MTLEYLTGTWDVKLDSEFEASQPGFDLLGHI
jgi:hypothetical protein